MTQEDPDETSARRSELAEIRRELRRKQDWVRDDEELWVRVSLFLQASAKEPIGSVGTLIRRVLQDLTRKPEHKMFDHRGVDEPKDAFPDRCEECPHYGVQCPMIARKTSSDKLDRIIENAEDDEALQAELYRYANKKDCHVIPEELDEWSGNYRTLIAKGEELRREVVAYTSGIDLTSLDIDAALLAEYDIDPEAFGLDQDDLDEATATSVDDLANVNTDDGVEKAPTGETARRVAAVTEAMEADDEEAEAFGGAD